MENNILKENKTYLVKPNIEDCIKEVSIMNITKSKKYLKVLWIEDRKCEWILMEDFLNIFSVLDVVGDFVYNFDYDIPKEPIINPYYPYPNEPYPSPIYYNPYAPNIPNTQKDYYVWSTNRTIIKKDND